MIDRLVSLGFEILEGEGTVSYVLLCTCTDGMFGFMGITG